jgi:hypothetical protein
MTPLRVATVACLLLACKRESPATIDARPTAEPAPSATEAPSATASEAPAPSAAPSAGAPHPHLPTTASAIPAAWLACTKDADCVALPSKCCGAWPSNVGSRVQVERALAAADAARGNCPDRVCAMRLESAACERGRCVVR